MALGSRTEISSELLSQIESDLGLNFPFVRGSDIPVRNCWHFYTDGNNVDELFYSDKDFKDGVNRLFVVLQKYRVVILAFVLMDTHVHFVLYGTFLECNRFVHEFIRRTSIYIAVNHGDNKKLADVEVSNQMIDTDYYLKVCICYVIKNPCSAGMPYQATNYPWSSGALYFTKQDNWTCPSWKQSYPTLAGVGVRKIMGILKTHDRVPEDTPLINGMVFPGIFVAYELTERIFGSFKSFNYFMGLSKEREVDGRGGCIANLSLPIREMRQHKQELCRTMFGAATVKKLDTTQRLILARKLRKLFNSSSKQVCRLCGLVYQEVKDML